MQDSGRMPRNPYEPFGRQQNQSVQSGAKPSRWPTVIAAILGLVLVSTGLGLAALSDPRRFSLSVADDRRIHLLVISALACTLCGVVLFLLAVRKTTRAMPEHCKAKANAGVTVGVALQLVALFLIRIGSGASFAFLPLILGSIFALLWGASNYAAGKGYPKRLGLLGIFGVAGLVVLILLPHQPSGEQPRQVS